MRWGKIVLLFQAVLTLLISIAFFSQLVTLSNAQVDELKVEMSRGFSFFDEDAPKVMVDIKSRYTVAAYTLLTVAIIEILILSRLFS